MHGSSSLLFKTRKVMRVFGLRMTRDPHAYAAERAVEMKEYTPCRDPCDFTFPVEEDRP
jgi:hypothetical protein